MEEVAVRVVVPEQDQALTVALEVLEIHLLLRQVKATMVVMALNTHRHLQAGVEVELLLSVEARL